MTPPAGSVSGAFRRLARLHGIQTSYVSGRRRVTASHDSILGTLRALGTNISAPDEATAAIRERERRLESQLIEPVHVLWDGGPGSVVIRSQRPADCVLVREDGGVLEWRTASGQPVTLPKLPFGYHKLTLRSGGTERECLIISAPSRAFDPPGNPRTWGIFLPLYALRSRTDWGVGDFTSLERLAGFTGDLGGSLVATLPLFATFLDEPFNPSPYAPASRLFWNELYIGIERVPELQDCPEARDLIASSGFQQELSRLRSAGLVDYRGVMAAKRRALAHLSAALSGSRLEAFNRFVGEQPALRDYARFRAAGERRRSPWTEWPEPARSGGLAEGGVDHETERYHQYVQWVAEEQLASAAAEAGRHGVSLYFDLPVGSSRDSYDVWRNQGLYALNASTGAPPDAFFVQGQDWGFPPLHPDAVREGHYAGFIAMLRRLLTFAGALRIDHVMALHRLYWIPQGFAATEGVYVHYRADEAFAILCLESHRHHALIVGEDLGTVPPYARRSLARHNIPGMYVMQYQVLPGEPPRVGRAPARSVAALGTHDMPPFAGWLQGADIEDSTRLGFLNEDGAIGAREARRKQRSNLTRFLQCRGFTSGDPSPIDLLRGSLRHLGAGLSRAMLINLEDLWLETRPQNIPGTTTAECPNWERKAARSLEEVTGSPEFAHVLRDVNAVRRARRPR